MQRSQRAAQVLGSAQRLKRVFGIETQRCEHCGGAVKIIASIEYPQVADTLLHAPMLSR